MRRKIGIAKVAGLFFLVLGLFVAFQSFAITGPSAGAGVGSGAISVDSNNNLSVGGSAASSVKFQIVGTDATSGNFGLKVMPSSGSTANFSVRNDGVITLASTTYAAGSICFGSVGATDCASTWSGLGGGGATSTPAGYVTPGYFNSIAGTGGNYSFPASLSIGTSTAPSGGVLFVNGNVGIGTTAPSARLDVKANTADQSTNAQVWRDSNNNPWAWMTDSGAFFLDNGALAGNNAPFNLGYNINYLKFRGWADDGLHISVGQDGGYANRNFIFSDVGNENHNFDHNSLSTDPTIFIQSHTNPDTNNTEWGSLAFTGTGSGGGYFNIKTGVGDLVLQPVGKVGIGTTTPGSPLTVFGQIYSSKDGFKFPDGTTQTTAATGGSGTNYFTLSGNNLYPTSTAYQLGIGTASPHYPLEVYGTSNKLGIIYSYNATQGDSTGGELYADSNGDLHINSKKTTTFIQNRNILLSEAGGNVGIGTSTPGSSLTVVGTVYSSTGGFKFPDGTTQTTAATGGSGTNYWTLSSGSLYPTSTAYNAGFGTASLDANYKITTAGGGIKAESTTQPAGYFNSSSGYGLIVNTGNVGIGTASPAQKLDVNGNLKTTGAMYFYDGASPTTSGGYFQAYGGVTSFTSQNNYDVDLSTSAQGIRIKGTNGDVGIGTSTPTAKLDVLGNILAGDRTSVADSYLDFGSAGAGSSRITRTGMGATDSSLAFSTTWGTLQERMRITGFGKVGIATTTPGSPLTVAGEIYSSTGGFKFPDGTTQTTAATGGSGTNYFTLSGTSLYPTSTAYKVGIATTTPGYPLTVDGTSMFTGTMTVGLTGAGKINAGTVDPPYTISGMQYATYVSGMTGQKEETTGEINIQCQPGSKCERVIDFKSAESGSDLWLFSKATNLKAQMDKMTVLLTPSFDGKVWYEKDAKNVVLKIFALPSDAGTYSVSYRLTAPRFDSANWLNTRNEPGVNGFVINN